MTVEPTPSVREAHLAELGHETGRPLHVGGLSAEELARRFGTPLYAYDARVLRERFQRVREALGGRVEISYALKANPLVALAELLRREGARAEVASAGEIHAALAAGFEGPEIQFAGPGKSREEIELSVEHGLARLNLESPAEYEVIASVARERGLRQGVAVRVNPERAVAARMHMGGGSQKFGVDVDQVEGLTRRILDEDVVELEGLHVYGGTQCFDAGSWLRNAKALLELAARLEDLHGRPLRELNFGGGFGIGYYEGDPTFDLGAAGEGLRALHEEDARPERAYHVELGRYLVATCGVYLTRVLYTKRSAGRTIAVVDGGMHHHAAAAGLGSIMRRSFPLVACHDVEGSGDPSGVGGPLCTPADEFCGAAALPEPSSGDLLAVLASGAYGLTFSTAQFLSHPTPAEVLVEGDVPLLARERGRPEEPLRLQRWTRGRGRP
jgi:diaminopimelate decarboxylase